MNALPSADPTGMGGLWPVPPAAPVERRVAFVPMTEADLDVVCDMEKRAYAHPWSSRHFRDSLAAGHPVVLLLGEARAAETALAQFGGRVLLGYLVAMPGWTRCTCSTSPWRRRTSVRAGGASCSTRSCSGLAGRAPTALWLEVRESNAPGARLYDALRVSPGWPAQKLLPQRPA
jgi:[ribosomal protein S18]-alanine N-acetyltransferase